jgi:DNA-binding response OmpR family regulator
MNSHSVLIIEDDPSLVRGLNDNFQMHGYQVRLAGDGREGLAAALDKSPDLVLLDIMLPTVNGYEVCRELRGRGLDMPIIMLTAKGQEEDIIRGLELGADDYITKPFSIRELLARVAAFLRRRATTGATRYHFGDFVLDLLAHQLTRSNQVVPLTSKEFRLLEFLLKRAGRALTRDQILDGVWGNEIAVNDRSVDRCVTTLRSKIEPVPHHPTFIRTIRDIGYRFESASPSEPDKRINDQAG